MRHLQDRPYGNITWQKFWLGPRVHDCCVPGLHLHIKHPDGDRNSSLLALKQVYWNYSATVNWLFWTNFEESSAYCDRL